MEGTNTQDSKKQIDKN